MNTTTNSPLSIGFQLHQSGQLAQAEQHYQRALALNPHSADALHLLGLLEHQLGNHDSAVQHLLQATTIEPENPLFHGSLALVYRELGQLENAAAGYRAVLRICPDDDESHYNLGVVLSKLGRLDEAVTSFQAAINCRPDFAPAHYNLGVVLEQLGRTGEAVSALNRSLQLEPDFAAYNNLGTILKNNKEYTQAITCYRRALALKPNAATTHFNLGAVYLEQEKFGDAAAAFWQAVQLDPNRPLWRLKLNQLCPSVMGSAAEIDGWRAQFEKMLDSSRPGSINLAEWLPDVIPSGVFAPFQLPYHGKNDRPLKEKYAALFAVPEAGVTPRAPRTTPYRVAFLVTRNHEGIFLSLMRGLVNHFPDAEFDVSVVCAAGGVTRLQSLIKNERVNFVPLPNDLGRAVKIIAAAQFDLIYYWEVGSDAMNYFLPFFRLAPVQVTSWGLSITTGIPQMDYFISSELLETEDADAHYSEQLVRFKTLPTWFYRPPLPHPLKPRGQFGLPETAHIYLCVQNLLKFHPDFDPLLAQILRRDPQGVLVLLESTVPQITWALRERFKNTLPDVLRRIRFVPQMDFLDYINLIAVSDVMLDTIHYGGGNTAHEALALGTPIVTLPSEFLRGRLTLGRFKKIGVLDTVAAGPAEYVDIAVRLGTDVNWRTQIRAKIRAANAVLYRDTEAVYEFKQFFRHAIEQ
ncbi:MAG: tetratricopeptide repeat protein [Chloroflexi bacterium]|nr:MAG: tetratricopeptide repeat protein [Chloroflexota bacterium]